MVPGDTNAIRGWAAVPDELGRLIPVERDGRTTAVEIARLLVQRPIMAREPEHFPNLIAPNKILNRSRMGRFDMQNGDLKALLRNRIVVDCRRGDLVFDEQ
ncbi:hypothetical protein [Sphingomonas endolithica]|uniref:hypothetical protein n=1 Tax=Sphingomonas endolithica TaxID=2972485 RepID=UPI0021AF3E49|nr:hypothetical protein [Sphingomonas sp. ZFBP2030]